MLNIVQICKNEDKKIEISLLTSEQFLIQIFVINKGKTGSSTYSAICKILKLETKKVRNSRINSSGPLKKFRLSGYDSIIILQTKY